MATVQQIRHAQRSDGPAAVLAIGTANPVSCMLQNDYADYYFRVTNSEHHADLKDKLKRICKTMHALHLQRKPNLVTYKRIGVRFQFPKGLSMSHLDVR